MRTPPEDVFRPGRVLLYAPSGFFGYAIAAADVGSLLRHLRPVSHCEMYKGNGHSYASRDFTGVGLYPLRREQLTAVLEFVDPLDLDKVATAFAGKDGHPYDMPSIYRHLTLGLTEGTPGAEVCSELLTYLCRAGGAKDLFRATAPDDIKPVQFLDEVPRVLRVAWLS